MYIYIILYRFNYHLIMLRYMGDGIMMYLLWINENDSAVKGYNEYTYWYIASLSARLNTDQRNIVLDNCK